jgi:hypothetical protein
MMLCLKSQAQLMHPDPIPDSDWDCDLLYGWTLLAGLMALYVDLTRSVWRSFEYDGLQAPRLSSSLSPPTEESFPGSRT